MCLLFPVLYQALCNLQKMWGQDRRKCNVNFSSIAAIFGSGYIYFGLRPGEIRLHNDWCFLKCLYIFVLCCFVVCTENQQLPVICLKWGQESKLGSTCDVAQRGTAWPPFTPCGHGINPREQVPLVHWPPLPSVWVDGEGEGRSEQVWILRPHLPLLGFKDSKAVFPAPLMPCAKMLCQRFNIVISIIAAKSLFW